MQTLEQQLVETARQRDELLEAAQFLSDQLDELINRHYGGEIPCTDAEIEGFEKAAAIIARATGAA